jgi:hypothetical protein
MQSWIMDGGIPDVASAGYRAVRFGHTRENDRVPRSSALPRGACVFLVLLVVGRWLLVIGRCTICGVAVSVGVKWGSMGCQ